MEKASTPLPTSVSTNGCLGCRNFLKEGQQLQLEDIRVEFKNFTEIPLRQAKHKYTLLKTINAFLNTKGGSIYLGVEDSNCKVRGYYLSMKQQDEFKFFVKGLVEKMHPPIDFSNRQEVTTFFLPVMNSDKFTGKYIVKIVVRQGCRDRVYTFNERIKLISADKTEYEEFELRYAYKRVGPGGIEKFDPLNLLEEVYRKAKSPNEEEKTHEGCHPRPLEPTYSLKAVGFSGLYSRNLREKLTSKFNAQLQKEPMECQINYDEDTRVLLVEFEKEEDAEKIKNLLHEHLEVLMSEDIELEYVGAELGTYLFRNKKKLSINYDEKSRDKSKSPVKEVSEQPIRSQLPKPNFKKEKGQQSPQLQPSVSPTVPSQSLSYQIQPKESRKEGYYYALSHININLRERLVKFLNGVFSKKMYNYEILINSILIHCDNEEEIEHIRQTVLKNEKELHQYGHNGKIVYGETTGHLCIYNYQEKIRKELLEYVKRLLDNQVIGWEWKKDSNDKSRSYLDLKMDPKQAVHALDKLLKDEDLRGFRLKGHPNDTPKMKVMLRCINT